MNKQLCQYIDQGYAVITASQRQARALQVAYANQQLKQGKSVWRTPPIKTWPVWIKTAWEDSPGESSKVLLTPSQQQLIWQTIIESSVFTKDILQKDTLVDTAIEAYETCLDWDMEIFPENTFLNNDAFAFKNWVQAYRKKLADNNWLDAGSLQGELIRQDFKPDVNGIVVYGYDLLTKAQTNFLMYLKETGCDVIEFTTDSKNQSTAYYSYPDADQELRSAACWARQILIDEPNATIGIVIPDLNKRRSTVTSIFDSIIHPDWALREQGTFQRQYSIAPGRSLSDYPLVHAAIEILSLGYGQIPMSRLEFLLRTSFVHGAGKEANQRAKFYAAIRDTGEPAWQISNLLEYCQLHQQYISLAKGFIKQLADIQAAISALPKSQLPRAWADTFNSILKLFGWPGERTLSSIEFQTLKAWREALLELAAMGTVATKWNYAQAFTQLKDILQEKHFQPETVETPIQISGLPGIAGMAFDYLRVIGMHDLIWPGPAITNPLIPLIMQQLAGVPGSTAVQVMAQCKKDTSELIKSARQVVFSYAKQEGDREYRPSPVLRQYLAMTPEQTIMPGYHAQVFTSQELETYTDIKAPVFATQNTASGGSGILSDQSACAFRAFAHHRLHAKGLGDVEIGLDPATRGSLVHEVMYEVWKRIGTWQELKDIPNSKLEAMVNAMATGAIRNQAKLKPETFTPEFKRLETRRLVALVMQWMNIEWARPEFTISDLEKRHVVNFHGLNLRMRIDRIDDIPEVGKVLIDYKTGDVTIKKWEGDRPEEPQLPLYAVTLKDDIKAVAFGGMKKGRLGYTGLGETEELINGVKSAGDTAQEWQDQLRQWETILAGLADEYLQGHASVTPTENACRYCDLHSLCRIREREWLMNDDNATEV